MKQGRFFSVRDVIDIAVMVGLCLVLLWCGVNCIIASLAPSAIYALYGLHERLVESRAHRRFLELCAMVREMPSTSAEQSE